MYSSAAPNVLRHTQEQRHPACVPRCNSCTTAVHSKAPLLDVSLLIPSLLLASPRPSKPPRQHVGQGFPLDWFTHTFNKLSAAMSVLAVAMGPAVMTAHDLAGGALGPFKISLILAGINGFLLFSWRRDSNKAPPACGDIGRLGSHAWAAVFGSGSGRGGDSNKIALVAVTQGCFEASTFAFALLWTPLLRPARNPGSDDPTPQVELPWGIVFSQQLVGRSGLVAMVVAVWRYAGYA